MKKSVESAKTAENTKNHEEKNYFFIQVPRRGGLPEPCRHLARTVQTFCFLVLCTEM